jgi:hypothetical protein
MRTSPASVNVGVRDQIAQDLDQQVSIRPHGDPPPHALHHQRDGVVAAQHAVGHRELLEHLLHVELRDARQEVTRADLGQFELLVDDLQRVAGGAVGHLQVLAHLVGELVRGGVEHQLQQPVAPADRVAQLVGHRAEQPLVDLSAASSGGCPVARRT